MKSKLVTGLLTIATSALLSTGAAAETVIQYWGASLTTYDQEKAAIDEFNRRNEGRIQVEMGPPLSPSDLREKLSIAIAGGAAPDVVRFDRFAVAEWVYKGLFQPLDPFIARDKVDRKDFFPAAWNETVIGGKTYGIPWNMDVRAYLYNKATFTQAGLDAGHPPRSWSDLKTVSSKLDRWVENRLTRAGFLASEGNWGWYGWLLAAGGEIVDATGRKVVWNSVAGLQAAEFYRENFQHLGGKDPIAGLKRPGGLYGAMADGRYASLMGGSWFIGSILDLDPDANIGVAPAPRPDRLAGQPVSWSGGFALVIPVATKQQEAAWEFIQYFTGKEAISNTLREHGIGQLPARRSVLLDGEYRRSLPRQIDDLLQILPDSRFRPVIPGGEALWNIYWSNLPRQLEDGKVPPRQVLDQTAQLGQVVLSEAWAAVPR